MTLAGVADLDFSDVDSFGKLSGTKSLKSSWDLELLRLAEDDTLTHPSSGLSEMDFFRSCLMLLLVAIGIADDDVVTRPGMDGG